MRWRIGLLQDSAALERQAARDAAKKEREAKKSQVPTVKTEAETKAEEDQTRKDAQAEEKDKHPPQPKIKPLSETKAIESGANFISETFLFAVAAGLILFESWRSSRKEKNRRDKVADQIADLEEENKAARLALVELEHEVLRLRAKEPPHNSTQSTRAQRILPEEVYDLLNEDKLEDTRGDAAKGWFSSLASLFTKEEVDQEAKTALDTNSPGPAEKLLQQSDKALEERRKQREAEDTEQSTGAVSKTSPK